MEILDVFNQNAFGVISLSAAISDMTPQFGYLESLNLFPEEGVTQRTVAVDFDVTNNQLLPQSQWGGPAPANKSAKGKTRSYAIPHFPVEDQMLAADLQGRRRPGTDMTVDMQYVLSKKMREMRLKIEQTKEWLRLGVLKSGQIKDGAGNLILDIYADFGISQDSTSFVLGTTTTDVLGKIATVKRQAVKALRGSPMSYFLALCSDSFYDDLVSHPNVQKAFQYFQNGNGYSLDVDLSFGATKPDAEARFTPPTSVFKFGGVGWINYSGTVPDSTGAAQALIDDGSAYMFPMGTDAFKTWHAPADYMETVNTMGLPFYAKQERTKYDKGIDVECQSNPLPICLKPKVIQKCTVA